MEQMKICHNYINLAVISQCNFHHSTILGMPGDNAVDQSPEGTEAIPARASLKTL
jgi:hypothetical protein